MKQRLLSISETSLCEGSFFFVDAVRLFLDFMSSASSPPLFWSYDFVLSVHVRLLFLSKQEQDQKALTFGDTTRTLLRYNKFKR
jgi:hypothetical protein